jgi:hypothetical protein
MTLIVYPNRVLAGNIVNLHHITGKCRENSIFIHIWHSSIKCSTQLFPTVKFFLSIFFTQTVQMARSSLICWEFSAWHEFFFNILKNKSHIKTRYQILNKTAFLVWWILDFFSNFYPYYTIGISIKHFLYFLSKYMVQSETVCWFQISDCFCYKISILARNWEIPGKKYT